MDVRYVDWICGSNDDETDQYEATSPKRQNSSEMSKKDAMETNDLLFQDKQLSLPIIRIH